MGICSSSPTTKNVSSGTQTSAAQSSRSGTRSGSHSASPPESAPQPPLPMAIATAHHNDDAQSLPQFSSPSEVVDSDGDAHHVAADVDGDARSNGSSANSSNSRNVVAVDTVVAVPDSSADNSGSGHKHLLRTTSAWSNSNSSSSGSNSNSDKSGGGRSRGSDSSSKRLGLQHSPMVTPRSANVSSESAPRLVAKSPLSVATDADMEHQQQQMQPKPQAMSNNSLESSGGSDAGMAARNCSLNMDGEGWATPAESVSSLEAYRAVAPQFGEQLPGVPLMESCSGSLGGTSPRNLDNEDDEHLDHLGEAFADEEEPELVHRKEQQQQQQRQRQRQSPQEVLGAEAAADAAFAAAAAAAVSTSPSERYRLSSSYAVDNLEVDGDTEDTGYQSSGFRSSSSSSS